MVTLFPVTLQLYPDEYAGLAAFCEGYACWVISNEDRPGHIKNQHLLVADLYARLFTYPRQQAWKSRRGNKRYALKLSMLYVRLLHILMQQHQLTPSQQQVLGQFDQLLI